MSFRLWGICVAVAAALAFVACADDGDRVLQPTSDARSGEAGAAPEPPLSGGGGGDSEGGGAGQPAGGSGEPNREPKTVLVVLEGFRAEQLSAKRTPNLWAMAEDGVRFANHHSVLPSNRMAAAASLATGRLPGRHGVLGDRMYVPGVAARDSQGRALVTSQPIRIDDHGTLESLQRELPGGLLQSKSLFEIAQAAGLRTAVIGRGGPASLFDIERKGWVLNDNYVFPREFALEVASLELGLPTDATALLPDLVGKSAYGTVLEADIYGGNASLGASTGGSWRPSPNANAVLNPLLPELHVYRAARTLELAAAGQVLTASAADLVVIWLRDPGETALRVGPSAEATVDAIANVDAALGELRRQLPEGSNLLVTSDGGTSALAGDARFFPRWGIGAGSGSVVYLPSRKASAPAGALQVDTPGGVPTDGAVRLVDLLTRSGFLAYDGEPCLSGHAYVAYNEWRKDWKVDSKDVCPDGAITGPALVPSELDARAIVVASNGASELLYVPSHRKGEVAKVVAFLQSRPEVGSIFVAPRYLKEDGDALPGTLSLELLGFSERTLLDILVTYAWSGDDPVAFGPLMQPVPPNKPALNDTCSAMVPCRAGLFCSPTSLQCRFCPGERDPAAAGCDVPEAELAQAQAASVFQQQHQSCEAASVCAPGLSCTYGVCTPHGAPPAWMVTEPPAGHLRGSSYGAMSGVRFAYKLGGATGNSSALRDDYFGVRGGASPADLSSFLIAVGPAFKSRQVIDAPSGVIDIAPTLLHLLQPGLESKLGDIDGRLLEEALVDGGDATRAEPMETLSSSVTSSFFSPTEPDSSRASLLTATGRYSSRLEGYSLDGGRTFAYVVLAAAERDGLTCETSADCPEGVSCGAKGVCLITPSCVDGVKNGAETDVDCGFAARCRSCYVGQACASPSDCESSVCTGNVCQAL